MKGTRFALTLGGAVLALALLIIGLSATNPPAPVSAQGPGPSFPVITGRSVRNDTSPALRNIPPVILAPGAEHEAAVNPRTGRPHLNAPDAVVQREKGPLSMPAPILNFDGIPYPGVVCNCAPPDTNGEVGLTQYVQIVNEGYQVFNKTTGASVLGPVSIVSIWSGFGGVCQTSGFGDPVVVYDQLANRWVVSQFAGSSVPTDECIAVSTTSDATGSYNRYDFHLGSNFFDYPKIAVWQDAYYMADNVFNSSGTLFLGPQPFAFDRSAMLAGLPATFVTTSGTLGSSADPIIPADQDGSALPPAGAPDTFLSWPGNGSYTVYHFQVHFGGSSTFSTFTTVPAAGFTAPCPTTRSCVPESGVTSSNKLDAIGDRLMFRLAYRNFGDHESVVGNYTVLSNAVTGVRWFEIRNVTSGPVTVFQESTYQPDTTWRWMGSAAMDQSGDMAVGFSASSSSIHPEVRYAGRLVTDPLNTLSQGETTLFAGPGSQTDTVNRWGDYSDMTVDPVDDCTFWYTQEYYPAGVTSFNWRTRIGNFKFPSCGVTASADLRTSKAGKLNANHTRVTYQITVKNFGPDTATNVVATDVLPPQVSFVSVTPGAGWTCSYDSPSKTVTCSAASEASGAALRATIQAAVVTTGSITNCATASSSTTDPKPNNNTGCVTLTAVTGGTSMVTEGSSDDLTSNTLLGGLASQQTASN